MDMQPGESGFIDGHAPIWCPEAKTDRNFLFLPHGKDFHERLRQALEAFKYCYSRKVNSGALVTVFGDAEAIQSLALSLEGVEYFYSEPAWK